MEIFRALRNSKAALKELRTQKHFRDTQRIFRHPCEIKDHVDIALPTVYPDYFYKGIHRCVSV